MGRKNQKNRKMQSKKNTSNKSKSNEKTTLSQIEQVQCNFTEPISIEIPIINNDTIIIENVVTEPIYINPVPLVNIVNTSNLATLDFYKLLPIVKLLDPNSNELRTNSSLSNEIVNLIIKYYSTVEYDYDMIIEFYKLKGYSVQDTINLHKNINFNNTDKSDGWVILDSIFTEPNSSITHAVEEKICRAFYNKNVIIKSKHLIGLFNSCKQPNLCIGPLYLINALVVDYLDSNSIRAKTFYKKLYDNYKDDPVYLNIFKIVVMRLAKCYKRNHKNHNKAIKLYNIAFTLGVGESMIKLAKFYMTLSNEKEALLTYRISVGKNNRIALLKLGDIELAKGRSNEALTFYNKAFELGNVDAMVVLGEYYENIDSNRSLEYFKMAHSKGLSIGTFKIGRDYLQRDQLLEAKRYLKEATERGNADALAELHVFYSNIEDKIAILSLAEKLGSRVSHLYLAKCYYDTDIDMVEKCIDKAKTYFPYTAALLRANFYLYLYQNSQLLRQVYLWSKSFDRVGNVPVVLEEYEGRAIKLYDELENLDLSMVEFKDRASVQIVQRSAITNRTNYYMDKISPSIESRFYMDFVEASESGEQNPIPSYNILPNPNINMDLVGGYNTNTPAISNVGINYEEVDKYLPLVKSYKKSIELGDTGAMKALADYYYVIEKNTIQAKRYYMQAIKINPSNKEAISRMAIIHFREDKHKMYQSNDFHSKYFDYMKMLDGITPTMITTMTISINCRCSKNY